MLSKFIDTKIPLVVSATVGLATVGAGLYYFYRKHLEEKQPTEWRKVGELNDLVCFPIKSCGPIRIDEFECSILGLQSGFLRDRIFMVTKIDGRFITARQYPKMVKIQPKFDENFTFMTLSAPGMMDVKVDLKKLLESPTGDAVIWNQSVKTVDCGDEVAKWCSKYILNEDIGLRLVYYPLDHPMRDVNEEGKLFRAVTKEDTGSLQDETSFMLMNEASIADLNTRIKDPVVAQQFRPNFVVKGPSSFEEDNWKWVKIGDNAIFRIVRPCNRCVFTNIDPETGVSNKEGQPLKTLREYRKLPKCGKAPVFGVHLGLRAKGTVCLGDSIYVEA